MKKLCDSKEPNQTHVVQSNVFKPYKTHSLSFCFLLKSKEKNLQSQGNYSVMNNIIFHVCLISPHVLYVTVCVWEIVLFSPYLCVRLFSKDTHKSMNQTHCLSCCFVFFVMDFCGGVSLDWMIKSWAQFSTQSLIWKVARLSDFLCKKTPQQRLHFIWQSFLSQTTTFNMLNKKRLTISFIH